MLLETDWSSKLNPLLANPLNNVSILKDIALVTGANVINHKLGKMQQGYFLVDQQAAANIYRSEPFTSTTLTLTSSAPATVSIGVF